uniref:Uncharacterized protein n=1 Tax=Oryza nivara TaxID=4536 RepID=A0A0E0HZQ1_ORYNI
MANWRIGDWRLASGESDVGLHRFGLGDSVHGSGRSKERMGAARIRCMRAGSGSGEYLGSSIQVPPSSIQAFDTCYLSRGMNWGVTWGGSGRQLRSPCFVDLGTASVFGILRKKNRFAY